MRLGILRRFSYLIHRRTRSDPVLLQSSRPAAAFSSSISLDGLQQRNDLATCVIDTVLPPAPVLSPFMPIHIPPDVEDPTPRSIHSQRLSPRSPVVDSDPWLRLSAAQKHAGELAAQSSQLKASLEALKIESNSAEGAARKAKNDLDHVRSLANRQKRASADLELRVKARRDELIQCEAFAKALSEPDLLALARARSGLATSPETTSGQDFEESAVEAIREASSNDGGIWSKIVSLVIGPRAPDNYINTINMTLQARQELRYWRKVSNFWKKTARESNINTGAPTPSTSNVSEIREILSDERKRAVQELTEKRKTLGLNTTCNESTSSGSLSSSLNESFKLSYRLPESQPSFTSVMSTMSKSVSSRESTVPQSADRLAPLASDLFKQDLLSSHSAQRMFSSSSHKSLWSSFAAEKQVQVISRPSEKSFGKRKAVSARDSSASTLPTSFSFESNVGQIGSSAIDSSSSSGHLSSLASFNSNASRQGVPISHLWTGPKSLPEDIEPSHNSLTSAERALESFERICNRFSSASNLGSLQSISEESAFSNPTTNGPQIVVHISEELSSESLSSAGSMGDLDAQFATLHPELCLPVSKAPTFEGDMTLVESGSEESNQGLTHHENDMTLVEVDREEGLKAIIKEDASLEDGPLTKKSRLPFFKIPDRLSQMSKMTGSSSKKSLSSFRSRNSSSTISTVASKENNGPRSVKNFLVGIPGFKPILPLRIIKKDKLGTNI
ncbi:hypothetical protein F5879DRAFT_1000092 [Lentinula edodes]|nr:hypothetical protein F5879DRAFT_1000092 [Lentinula edodes]